MYMSLLTLQAQPGLCCGSVHPVLDVAQDTGPMGTQDGLWPGDAGAVMQQGWGTLATSPPHQVPPATPCH